MLRQEFFFQKRKTLAAIGFLSSIPALFFCTAAILVAFVGLESLNPILGNYSSFLDNPVLLLGRLTLAFVLNILPLFRFAITSDLSEVTGVLMLKNRMQNIVVVLLSCGLLGMLLTYAFVENFQVIPR